MVGDALRKARLAAGLTQEELAFKAGLHSTFVTRLETGRKAPSLKTLFRIAMALDIKPSQLVARIEATFENDERALRRWLKRD